MENKLSSLASSMGSSISLLSTKPNKSQSNIKVLKNFSKKPGSYKLRSKNYNRFTINATGGYRERDLLNG